MGTYKQIGLDGAWCGGTYIMEREEKMQVHNSTELGAWVCVKAKKNLAWLLVRVCAAKLNTFIPTTFRLRFLKQTDHGRGRIEFQTWSTFANY